MQESIIPGVVHGLTCMHCQLVCTDVRQLLTYVLAAFALQISALSRTTSRLLQEFCLATKGPRNIICPEMIEGMCVCFRARLSYPLVTW